jgi:hypothetical protein
MIFSQSQLGILPTIGNGIPAILQMAATETRVTGQMEITAILGVNLLKRIEAVARFRSRHPD